MDNQPTPDDLAMDDQPTPEENAIVKKLQEIDDRYLSVEKELFQAREELQKKYDSRRRDCLLRRRYLLTMKTQTGQWTHQADTGTPSLPGFWCQVLQQFSKTGPDIIRSWDLPVLQYLTDITTEASELKKLTELSASSFKLVFHFAENPFLTNTEVALEYRNSEGSPWDSGAVVCEEITCSSLEWKAGMDVTVHPEPAKDSNEGAVPPIQQKANDGRRESFFRSFLRSYQDDFEIDVVEDIHLELPQHLVQNAMDRRDFLQDMMDVHFQIGADLRDHVAPFAVRWYTGEGIPQHPQDEEEEGTASKRFALKDCELEVSIVPACTSNNEEMARPKAKGKGAKGKRQIEALVVEKMDETTSGKDEETKKYMDSHEGETPLASRLSAKGKGNSISSSTGEIDSSSSLVIEAGKAKGKGKSKKDSAKTKLEAPEQHKAEGKGKTTSSVQPKAPGQTNVEAKERKATGLHDMVKRMGKGVSASDEEELAESVQSKAPEQSEAESIENVAIVKMGKDVSASGDDEIGEVIRAKAPEDQKVKGKGKQVSVVQPKAPVQAKVETKERKATGLHDMVKRMGKGVSASDEEEIPESVPPKALGQTKVEAKERKATGLHDMVKRMGKGVSASDEEELAESVQSKAPEQSEAESTGRIAFGLPDMVNVGKGVSASDVEEIAESVQQNTPEQPKVGGMERKDFDLSWVNCEPRGIPKANDTEKKASGMHDLVKRMGKSVSGSDDEEIAESMQKKGLEQPTVNGMERKALGIHDMAKRMGKSVSALDEEEEEIAKVMQAKAPERETKGTVYVKAPEQWKVEANERKATGLRDMVKRMGKGVSASDEEEIAETTQAKAPEQPKADDTEKKTSGIHDLVKRMGNGVSAFDEEDLAGSVQQKMPEQPQVDTSERKALGIHDMAKLVGKGLFASDEEKLAESAHSKPLEQPQAHCPERTSSSGFHEQKLGGKWLAEEGKGKEEPVQRETPEQKAKDKANKVSSVEPSPPEQAKVEAKETKAKGLHDMVKRLGKGVSAFDEEENADKAQPQTPAQPKAEGTQRQASGLHAMVERMGKGMSASDEEEIAEPMQASIELPAKEAGGVGQSAINVVAKVTDSLASVDSTDERKEKGDIVADASAHNEMTRLAKSRHRGSRDMVLDDDDRGESVPRPRGKPQDHGVPEQESTPRVRGKGKGKLDFSNDISDSVSHLSGKTVKLMPGEVDRQQDCKQQ